MFANDLRAMIQQNSETIKRLKCRHDPYEGRWGDLRRAFVSKSTKKLEPYRIFIPSCYTKKDSVPVLLTLHGGGGDENEFPDQDNGVMERILEQRGYIMVSPKATSWYDSPEGLADLVQLLELVQQEYPKADKSRIYCTGVSRGGFGSYELAATYPGLLAGIACVSGVGGKADINNLKNIPILILQGGMDSVVPPDAAQKAADKFKQLGFTYELKIFPIYEHNYHSEEYMKLTLDFFEKHRKK